MQVHEVEGRLLADELPGRPRPRSLDGTTLARIFQRAHSPLLEHTRRLARAVSTLDPDPEHAIARPATRVVGGFVRDTILGLAAKDIDVEIYGVSAARLAPLLEGVGAVLARIEELRERGAIETREEALRIAKGLEAAE